MRNRCYAERSKTARSPLARKLLRLMSDKETNLAFSADVTEQKRLIELCEILGPHICVLKTHLDILNDMDSSLSSKLKDLAEKHGFLILEDRKFADIGSTVQSQYRDGYLKIADWADLITVHGIAGPGTVQGLREVGLEKGRACLLLAEMSSSGNLLSEEYTAAILSMAEKYNDFVLGFIAQKRLMEEDDFVYFTPGIGIAESKDALGQKYNDPRVAVAKNGSDVIIVGRHIYNAKDPLSQAILYREQGWKGYLDRVGA